MLRVGVGRKTVERFDVVEGLNREDRVFWDTDFQSHSLSFRLISEVSGVGVFWGGVGWGGVQAGAGGLLRRRSWCGFGVLGLVMVLGFLLLRGGD